MPVVVPSEEASDGAGTRRATQPRFAFGRNWSQFVQLVDDARIESAVRSVREMLGADDLSGRRFLDAGCGSGLFSLAAVRLGADVHAFDYDEDSVRATSLLRARFAPDSRWTIERGSVLDAVYLEGLGSFDVVYSWGVLHHTGALWDALDNVARLVAPGGLLAVSIYNDQGRTSERWRRVKRAYVEGTSARRAVLVAAAALKLYSRSVGSMLLRGHGPRSIARSLGERGRGMSARRDLVDWVGGYPFEVAKPEEVFARVRPLGFDLRHLKTCGGGLGCNEFVFAAPGTNPSVPTLDGLSQTLRL